MFQSTAQAKQAQNRAQGILWSGTATPDDLRKAAEILRKAEAHFQRSSRTRRR